MIDDRLAERGFGSLEGGSTDVRYISDFWDHYLNKSDYGVEPIQNLFRRTKEFIDYLRSEYNDKRILIASHAATIRALHYNIVGYNQNTDMLSFVVDNGKIFRYDL